MRTKYLSSDLDTHLASDIFCKKLLEWVDHVSQITMLLNGYPHWAHVKGLRVN